VRKMGYSIFWGKVLSASRHKNAQFLPLFSVVRIASVVCLATYLPTDGMTTRPTVLAHICWAKRRFDDVVLKRIYVVTIVQYAKLPTDGV